MVSASSAISSGVLTLGLNCASSSSSCRAYFARRVVSLSEGEDMVDVYAVPNHDVPAPAARAASKNDFAFVMSASESPRPRAFFELPPPAASDLRLGAMI
jgi:hypothetical protein